MPCVQGPWGHRLGPEGAALVNPARASMPASVTGVLGGAVLGGWVGVCWVGAGGIQHPVSACLMVKYSTRSQLQGKLQA